MGKSWNAPRARAAIYQLIAIAAVISLVAVTFSNTLDNLAGRGIASGFGFLDTTAGFGIGMSLIEYSETSTFGRAFLVGLANTLLVSAIAIVAATVIGFAIGIARLSSNWLIARLAAGYVELLRNIPLLLQIFFWYFAVLRALPAPRDSFELLGGFLNNRGLYLPAPVFEPATGWAMFAVALIGTAAAFLWWRSRGVKTTPGWIAGAGLVAVVAVFATVSWERPALRGLNFQGGITLIPELVALAVALASYTAAFIAEVVRAGISSVPRGQTEAADALGLTRAETMRFIVIPQALRVIVPPLTNQYLNLTKNSSLAAAIAYPDLVSVFAGTVLNVTGQAVEVIAITMAVYLTISLTISLAMNRYNRAVLGGSDTAGVGA
jgi:general L-amino acid transport system permease protein